jgi:hypothetical protein
MELAIVLSLRVYHIVPASVLRGIIRHRARLRRLYRRAYEKRRSGAEGLVILGANQRARIQMRGLLLDLNIKFSAGRLACFGPPRLVSSIDALQRCSERSPSNQASLPIQISMLSEQVAALALAAPSVRSGPPSRSK